MELKIKIGYKEVLELIKQLPKDQLLALKEELEQRLHNDSNASTKQSLREIFLKGPVMTDDQYNEFLEMRQSFDAWRAK